MKIWNLKLNKAVMIFDLLEHFQKSKLIKLSVFAHTSKIFIVSNKIVEYKKVDYSRDQLNEELVTTYFDIENNHLVLVFKKSIKIIDVRFGRLYLFCPSVLIHQESVLKIFL